jgi:hypothetical protein
LKQRSKNIAVLKLDFKDNLITRINIVERLSFGDKIAALGGIIGKTKHKIFCIPTNNL